MLECPQHGWQFDRQSGRCLNSPGQALGTLAVELRGEELFALVPGAPPRPREGAAPIPTGLTFRLHAHACLEIDHGGFSLLTDPWISGPAFFGSWAAYPPPLVDVDGLTPDALWISHEHSDHFHEPTLRRLPKDVPVYVPDFPNRRLPARLTALGFEDVRALPFGESRQISASMTLTCLEPASLWNDAIVLIEIDGFRFLNVNDAGVNERVARLLGPVDAMASTFSPGASGYPLTWRHISDERKLEILERSRAGVLDMLRDAARTYGARYLIPFASFFVLWHPEHRRHLGQMRRNAPEDVVRAFEGTDVEVVDMVAGESWEPASGTRTRRAGRERMFELGSIVRHVKQSWDPEIFAAEFPAADRLPAGELEAYLVRLNDVPEMVACEDLTAVIRGIGGDGRAEIEAAFEIRRGRLALLDAVPADVNLTIEMPHGVLARVVASDISWDEAFIGYWCQFDRSPDVYHAGFWRLLQAPYYRRPPDVTAAGGEGIGADTSIQMLLERYGEGADRLMRRYGLYCLGCRHAPAETLRHGADKHGLTELQLERLVRELRFAVAGEPVAALLAGASSSSRTTCPARSASSAR